MAPVVAVLLLALAGAASAVVPISCDQKKTGAGKGAQYKYQCTFCNPMGHALRFPRLTCTNFQDSTNRDNIGLTSPYCYITQFNRIDPQTCTRFSFRTPFTSANVSITFDSTPPNSAILTPITGEKQQSTPLYIPTQQVRGNGVLYTTQRDALLGSS